LGSLPKGIRAGLKAAGSCARPDARVRVLLDMLLAIVDWAAFQKPFDWYARRPILPLQSRLPHQSISQPCRTAPWLNSFQINALNLVGKIGLPSSFGEKTAECCAHAPSRDAGKTLVFRGDYALARAGEPVLLDGECCGKGNREGEALWLPLFNNFMTLFLANASQDDADLVLGGMVLARSMANIAHQLFGRHTGGWSGGFQIASLVP
jgi:hypothetical protein